MTFDPTELSVEEYVKQAVEAAQKDADGTVRMLFEEFGTKCYRRAITDAEKQLLELKY